MTFWTMLIGAAALSVLSLAHAARMLWFLIHDQLDIWVIWTGYVCLYLAFAAITWWLIPFRWLAHHVLH